MDFIVLKLFKFFLSLNLTEYVFLAGDTWDVFKVLEY